VTAARDGVFMTSRTKGGYGRAAAEDQFD